MVLYLVLFNLESSFFEVDFIVIYIFYIELINY